MRVTTKTICRTVTIVLAALMTMACDRRPLTTLEEGAVTLNVNVDWGQYNAGKPSSITLLCYPAGGGAPEIRTSDDPEKAVLSLPIAEYKIVVLGGTMADYPCYDFTLEPTLGVTLRPGCTPVPFGVDAVDVKIPAQSTTPVDLGGTLYIPDVAVTAPTLYPRNIVWTCCIDVVAAGFDYAQSLEGSLSGLASGYGVTAPAVTHELAKECWTRNKTDKTFSTSFMCLGLPETYAGREYDNTLALTFTLINGDEVSEEKYVGNLIEIDNSTNTLYLKTAATVKQTSTGYDIDIEPWGRETTTRAEAMELEQLKTAGFHSSIVWDGEEWCSNEYVSWGGNMWMTTDLLFWPAATASMPCTFYATSCGDSESQPITVTDGVAQMEYTVAMTAAEQRDLLTATATATATPADGVQHLHFTHALTKVNFNLFVDPNNEDNEGYVWRVASLTLTGRNQGTYTFGATPAWSVTGEATDMEYMTVDETVDVACGAAWTGNNNFMLLPQNGEEVTVTVTWVVLKNMDGTLVQTSHTPATRHYTIGTDDWAPGVSKRYTSLRLPSIGEKTDGTGDGALDDNNMTVINYDPNL